MSNYYHWSYSAQTVKVFGVNAIVCIPLLGIAIRPSSVTMIMAFIVTLVFFIVVENFMHLRAAYFPTAMRYALMGNVKTPKSNNFDF